MQKKRQQRTRLRLPRLTNEEFDLVSEMARKTGIPLSQCPTCGAKRIEVEEGVWGWENGTYRLDGEDHPCDCQTQMELRKHYYLAGIGDQYFRLNWDDFYGDPKATDAANIYLESWPNAKMNGMGLEFTGKLGVGKTFAATYIARELIKRGEHVYFTPFVEVVNLLSKDNDYRNAQEDRLRDTTVLILDEVLPAISAAQNQYFAFKLEELVRYRTNFNKPIIMTTNLTPEELRKEYPRTYSLLEAKQIRVEMNGTDARKGARASRNLELLANNEIEPIK